MNMKFRYCLALLVWAWIQECTVAFIMAPRQQPCSARSIQQLSSSFRTSAVISDGRIKPKRSGCRHTQLLSSLPSSSSSSSLLNGMKTKLSNLMTGADAKRPDWAMEWMPTWVVAMRPLAQLIVGLFLYIFHMMILTQKSIPLPFQLIPNNRGYFQSIGMDSFAGILTLGVYQYFQKYHEERLKDKNDEDGEQNNGIGVPVPKLLSTPHVRDTPWKNIYQSKYSRFSSFLACCALFQAYLWTGRLSLWWNDSLYTLANYFPMTIAMHRSLCVLMGHLSWVALGTAILRFIPRPQPFHKKWYSSSKDTQWLWWTIGGYYVSSFVFNMADFVNQMILPVPILAQASESVVSQLIQPEFNDKLASLVGFIAPCLTAPWWEEILYRGFLLPSLLLQMNYKWAVLWSGIIFSVHHLSPTACIPLAILGWTWSILYAKSGNLLTTILVHAMWNSRVFLGSWLGL